MYKENESFGVRPGVNMTEKNRYTNLDFFLCINKKMREIECQKSTNDINSTLTMPNKQRDHFSSRGLVCVCCGYKNTKCIILGPETPLLQMVQLYVNNFYDFELLSNPTGLCPSCKVHLYSAKQGVNLSSVTLENWLLTSERIRLLPRYKGKYKKKIVIVCIICGLD
jgi:hypothetical protein